MSIKLAKNEKERKITNLITLRNIFSYLAVYDNWWKTADRYTIIFWYVDEKWYKNRSDYKSVWNKENMIYSVICMSSNPLSPQGINMFNWDFINLNDIWKWWKEVKELEKLPVDVQKAIQLQIDNE